MMGLSSYIENTTKVANSKKVQEIWALSFASSKMQDQHVEQISFIKKIVKRLKSSSQDSPRHLFASRLLFPSSSRPPGYATAAKSRRILTKKARKAV
jgi:hypothetical protein